MDNWFTGHPVVATTLSAQAGVADLPIVNSQSQLLQMVTVLTGKKRSQLVAGEQVHGVGVAFLDQAFIIPQNQTVPGVDGLITGRKDVVLAVAHADCVPIFFFDPMHQAIGLLHSGWRGTVGKIGLVALELMGQQFHTKPEEVLIYLGPAIKQCCYRFQDVELFKGLPEWDEFYRKLTGGWSINLPGFIRHMFEAVGVIPVHIQESPRCSAEDKNLFSWTNQKQKGSPLARNLSIISLKTDDEPH